MSQHIPPSNTPRARTGFARRGCTHRGNLRSERIGRGRRSALLALGLFAGLLPLAGSDPASAEATLYWEHNSNESCGMGDSIRCGPRGIYRISTEVLAQRSPDCLESVISRGQEAAIGYPERATDLGNDLPCPSGNCFQDHPDHTLPGVAVIDWNDPHGWSVAGVIQSLVGEEASLTLLAFDDSRLGLSGTPGVTDAHVLEQLCRVLDTPPFTRPEIVNLSLGRPSVKKSCKTESSLECEIDAVVGALRTESHTITVAAAGHHERALFPASSGTVFSAGAVDLHGLAGHGEPSPAAQTPAGAQILVPGNGVFVKRKDGTVWPAPPGSSYASAVASGWLAMALVNQVTPQQLSEGLAEIGSWPIGPIPIEHDVWGLGISRFQLVPGTPAVAPSELVLTSIGQRMESCESAHELHGVFTVRVHGPAVLPERTLDDVRTLVDPCPDSLPCVPCHDTPGGEVMIDGATEPATAKAGTDKVGGGDVIGENPTPGGSSRLMIDLTSSQGIDRDSYRLLGVYLRIGGEDLAFTDSLHPQLLEYLAVGMVPFLEIENVSLAAWAQSVFLVFHLSMLDPWEADHAGDFVLRVPITVHGH
ncbi:MAG: S8/S53 family peptidase [Holophagales bacterium]|nr:S8/S53 family peptidase [Holophagales bacterium]